MILKNALTWSSAESSHPGKCAIQLESCLVRDLEAVDVVPETKLEDEPTESERKRKRKGKGKMVESHTKGDKRRYATRGEVQKLMGDALVANEVQTERNLRRKRDSHVLVEEPTSMPQHIGSSETDSDDMVNVPYSWEAVSSEVGEAPAH
uniref:Uncharacterized protein n=1 Tax=Solanum tuberosum TaxID=4113 RepID=M1DSW3_SOLTU